MKQLVWCFFIVKKAKPALTCLVYFIKIVILYNISCHNCDEIILIFEWIRKIFLHGKSLKYL